MVAESLEQGHPPEKQSHPGFLRRIVSALSRIYHCCVEKKFYPEIDFDVRDFSSHCSTVFDGALAEWGVAPLDAERITETVRTQTEYHFETEKQWEQALPGLNVSKISARKLAEPGY